MKIAVILLAGVSFFFSSCGNTTVPYPDASRTNGAYIAENSETAKDNENAESHIENTEKNTDSEETGSKAGENNKSQKEKPKALEETSSSDSENPGNQKEPDLSKKTAEQNETEQAKSSKPSEQSEPAKTEESSGLSKSSETSESAGQKEQPGTSETSEETKEDSGKPGNKTDDRDNGNTQQSQTSNGNFINGARTVFAPNASKENFYDINKLWDGNDTNLCWAAASSNLIAWWQDLYEKKGKKLPGKAVRDGNEIFSMFRKYKGDVSGTFMNGVPWYFTGNQSGKGGADGGFLLSLCGPEWNPLSPKAYSYYDERNLSSQKDFSELIISGLKKGAAGLKLHNRYDHAITLWGAECDDSGNVTAIFVTDSDDRFSGIKRYEIEHDGKNLAMKSYDISFNKITGAMFLYAP